MTCTPIVKGLRALTLGGTLVVGSVALLAVSGGDAGAAKTVNPCSLLTAAQVQPVLEGSVGKPAKEGEMCTLKTTGANGQLGNFVQLTVLSSYDAAQFKSDYTAPSRSAEGYKVVSGIGSHAVIRQSQNEIDFLKGSTLVSLDVDVRGSNGIEDPIAPSTLAFLARQAAAKVK